MCEYCGLESLAIEFYEYFSNDKTLEMKINKKSELTIEYDAYSNDSSFSVYRNINFCPMCGRNLKCEEMQL